MHPSRYPDNLALYLDLVQRRVQIGRLAERNVLILVAENLQKRWIAFRDIGDG